MSPTSSSIAPEQVLALLKSRRVCRSFAAENRNEEHHQNDADVLEKKDADSGASVRRVRLVALGVAFHNNPRAGKRHQKTEENRLINSAPEQNGARRRCRSRLSMPR